MNDSILLTSDVLARYKISRSTLYFWSTPERMPAGFTCPFPKPTIPGNPKRWRESEIVSPLKLIPNNALQVILPDTQPLALIIHIVVQVVSGHHPTHLMTE